MHQNEQKTDPGKRYTGTSRSVSFARVFNAFVSAQLELMQVTRRDQTVTVDPNNLHPGHTPRQGRENNPQPQRIKPGNVQPHDLGVDQQSGPRFSSRV
jgi:hypothetical protein